MEKTEVLNSLNWRYAVKKFDPTKKISDDNWNTLAESLRLAPSSYGLQPWKFIVVQNPEMREKLTPVSWNQTQVEDCSHYVVITTLKKVTEEHISKFIQKIADTRGLNSSTLNGYRDMMISDLVKGPRSETSNFWTQKQAYIAMGFLMETASLLKVDTCPLEGVEPVAYDKILNLENTEWTTVAAVACGYRHVDDKYSQLKKVRFDAKDVFQYI